MPVFEFTSPEGKVYEVEGPEGATKEQAWGILRQQIQMSAQPAAKQQIPQQAPQIPQQVQSQMAPQDIPTEENLAPQAPIETPKEPSLGQHIAGAGEAGLSALTGATGGAVGSLGGFLGGLAGAIRMGQLGSTQAADLIEQAAIEGGGRLTYAPRTQAGQQATEALGKTLEPLQALGPLGGEAAFTKMVPNVRARFAKAKIASGEESTIPISGAAQDKEILSTVRKAAVGGPGSGRAKRILADMAAPDQETIDAARRLGIEDYLQPDHVTTSQQFREIAQLAKTIPGSEARQAEITGLQQVAKRADDVISEIGGTDDWSSVSSNVKSKLNDIQSELDSKVEAKFSEVNDAIPPKVEAPANNLIEYIEGKADELGGINNLSPEERRVYLKMRPKKDGTQPTYAFLDKTRKELTAARVKRQGPFKDVPTADIKQLENHLLEDQRNIAEQHGVLDQFNDARRYTALRKGVEKDIQSLFGKQLDRDFITPLRTSIKTLPTGDVSKLKKLISSIPESNRQEVISTALEAAFGKTAKRGEISFANYSDWYKNAVKNKEAFSEVMKYLPSSAKQKLRDLYIVSSGIKKASKEYIPTGRGETLRQSLDSSESLIKNALNLGITTGSVAAADAVSGGLGSAALVGVLKLGLFKNKSKASIAVDKLLMSPEFRDLVNSRIKTGNVNNAKVRRLANSPSFKELAKAGIKFPGTPEAWILDAMQPETNQTREESMQSNLSE